MSLLKADVLCRPRQVGVRGSKIRDKHALVRDPYGNKALQKVGEVDQYEVIQSYRDACDIDLLVARYERGDVSALNKRSGFYGDLSSAPADPASYQRSLIFARGVFEKNAKIFEKYQGDFRKWLEDHQSPDAFDALFKVSQEGVKDQKSDPADNNES